VQGLPDVRRGHEEVGLVFAPHFWNDEAVIGGAAREPLDHEVHAVGKFYLRVLDLHENAVGDESAQDVFELLLRGRVEGERAHEIAHKNRLAETRHVVDHPAVEIVGSVYGVSVLGMVPEVGLECGNPPPHRLTPFTLSPSTRVLPTTHTWTRGRLEVFLRFAERRPSIRNRPDCDGAYRVFFLFTSVVV
jgi:hypothetical protein